MNGRRATLALTFPAEAGNVSIARHAVAGLAESIGMEPEPVADLKTVLTEACMNVVVHAYPDGEGSILIEAIPEDHSLTMVVSDTGTGIQPRADIETDQPVPSLRLGLSLIASLADSFSISGGLHEGTVVTMRIPLSSSSEITETSSDLEVGSDPSVRIVTGEPLLLSAVLSRAISAFGTQRDLSIDRISDAMLLADAVSAAAPQGFGNSDLQVSLTDGDGGIELSIGPLERGGESTLREGMKIPGGGGSVEGVADEIRIEEEDSGAYVVFRIDGPAERPSPAVG